MAEHLDFVISLHRTLRSVKYFTFTAPCTQDYDDCSVESPLLEFLRKRGLEPRLTLSAAVGDNAIERVYYLYAEGVMPVAKIAVEITREGGLVRAKVVEVQPFL